tara:strand:- start:350 stop:643 length:294 start_codon:yes stop_codon:yes gene_type:complete
MIRKITTTTIFLILLIFFNGCIQNSAFIAPVYTMAKSGNVYHAGLSYGSNQVVNKVTGRSTTENIKKIFKVKEEDAKFQRLTNKRIKETRHKIHFAN